MLNADELRNPCQKKRQKVREKPQWIQHRIMASLKPQWNPLPELLPKTPMESAPDYGEPKTPMETLPEIPMESAPDYGED